MSCLTDDRLQDVIFEHSPLSLGEEAHLRVCQECQPRFKTMQALDSTLDEGRHLKEESDFSNSLRASELSRALTPIIEAREQQIRLVTFWGPIAAILLIVAIPADGNLNSSITTTIAGWILPQAALIQSYCGSMVASITGTTLLVALIVLLVVSSDLLTERHSRRQRF